MDPTIGNRAKRSTHDNACCADQRQREGLACSCSDLTSCSDVDALLCLNDLTSSNGASFAMISDDRGMQLMPALKSDPRHHSAAQSSLTAVLSDTWRPRWLSGRRITSSTCTSTTCTRSAPLPRATARASGPRLTARIQRAVRSGGRARPAFTLAPQQSLHTATSSLLASVLRKYRSTGWPGCRAASFWFSP